MSDNGIPMIKRADTAGAVTHIEPPVSPGHTPP